ncbi:uncharacterized protein LOC126666253 [Mercurialis annua]|uniref:uncharacterized protein LOC126666253 n=1 Tax=Mercurialis annua TaxID=3986 RepID=UPI00215E57D9|nr:uncharacterized protein LOC126666253 [Mercurialis annua]
MSILSKNSNMGTPSFHEFKKQASFFLKEKIKTARLALTDVTPAQLMTEEAINGNSWTPDSRTLGSISKAAFEVDDYWRIVEILHNRFLKFERKDWRVSYNSLILLEHLLTHGPESVAGEFQSDKDVIKKMQSFQFIDEKGFNWGLTVRKKSERIEMLLEKEILLKEERDRARKLTRGIQGFGSFCQRSSSTQGILQDLSHGTIPRSNSKYNEHDSQENQFAFSNQENAIQKDENVKKSSEYATSEVSKRRPNLDTDDDDFSDDWMHEKPETSFKENNPLLDARRDEPKIVEEEHPFAVLRETETASSLVSERIGILQGV